jgi:hypothetical protein
MGGYGMPPSGGYPPGPPLPMPPRPEPPRGTSGATIALIVIVVLLVLGLGGCGICVCVGRAYKKDDSSEKVVRDPPRPTPPPSPPPPTDQWITADKPYVKFKAPAGWTTEITPDKEWGIFKSPARDAVFAFTTFTRPGESTRRLGRADRILGVTDTNWGTPRSGTVGKDRFPAHVGDGTCNYHGPNGYTWYATVNAGDTAQILLIFAVAPGAPQARRAEAQAAIDSLQRR